MPGLASPAARRLASGFPPRTLLLLLLAARVAVAAPRELVTHVQCQVCGMAVEQAYVQASDVGTSDEDGLSDMLEKLCSLKEREGRWLQTLDITGEAPRGRLAELAEAGLAWLAGWLEPLGLAPRAPRSAAHAGQQEPPRVVPQSQVGECRGECRTLHRACVNALKGKEEKLVTMLAQSKPVAEMREKVCKKSCDSKRLPKLGKWVDEAFIPRNMQDLETEDLIAKMQRETGMSMTSYKKEDMLAMSEGDMETMAAREAYASARMAQQQGDL